VDCFQVSRADGPRQAEFLVLLEWLLMKATPTS
jgi:hypothetical protein